MSFYRILSILLFPFIEIYLFWRVYKKKEDKKRLRERFGKPTELSPEGDLFWIHAVSVGETNSALIFVDELLKKFPQTTILFTTTTLTSASIIKAKIPSFKGKVIHQFLPIDSLFCVQDFLRFWQPKKVFFIESEIWPNLICESRKIGAKVFLINARMSEKSAKRWGVAHHIGFNIFDNFNVIFTQSKEDEQRFSKLTNSPVIFYGNLKSQARDLDFSEEELKKLKAQIGSRKFWLAASTHKGEEEIILQTHHQLKKDFPDLLTIIIPRHPNRSNEVRALLNGTKFTQRSRLQNIEESTEIYLADTLGELGTFYRLANFTFLGGSLLPIGGHNPFEPINLGCAVISGENFFNFKEVYDILQKASAFVLASSADEITKVVKDFLIDHQKAEASAQNGIRAINNSGNIAEKILNKSLEF